MISARFVILPLLIACASATKRNSDTLEQCNVTNYNNTLTFLDLLELGQVPFDVILEHLRKTSPYCHVNLKLISKQFYDGVERNLETKYSVDTIITMIAHFDDKSPLKHIPQLASIFLLLLLESSIDNLRLITSKRA